MKVLGKVELPTVTEDIAQFLLSEPGRTLLARVEQETANDPARALMRLRKLEDPERVTAAWELHAARKKSAAKFGDLGASLYFTTEALEQASSAGASTTRPPHIRSRGDLVIDLCGGIGADTLAFARAGLDVVLCEIDPGRALFAAENARAAGLAHKVTVRNVDATTVLADLKSAHPNAPSGSTPPAVSDNRRVNDPEDLPTACCSFG